MTHSTASPSRNEPHRADALRHTPFEDAQALVLGTALCALGVEFLTAAGLITGQTAGAAVLLSYVSPADFAFWFFVVNLPFYVLGWTRMGPRFVLKTVIAVSLVSGFSLAMPSAVSFDHLNPWAAAALAGGITGLGLIVVFRHGASLGGVGILALWMQERFRIQAGWVQLGFDAILFALALLVMDVPLVAASLLGAAVVNVIIAVNHRYDRYVGR
jgi:uncharacterized membrane-anchored protein YitT (DUF2179 family)